MANIFTLAHDSWTYQDISWSAPTGQTEGHTQILQDTKRTYLGTSEQMDAYNNILKYLNDILRQHENHKMQLCNDCNVNAGQKRVPNYDKKLYTHQWLCQICTMSVLPVWNSTIAFTLSRSNFNNFDARIFNKYQRFLLLRLLWHTGVAPTCSAQFSPAQSTKVQWF